MAANIEKRIATADSAGSEGSAELFRCAARLERLAADLSWFKAEWLPSVRAIWRQAPKDLVAPPAITDPPSWRVFCRHMLSVVVVLSEPPEKLFDRKALISSGELLALAVIAGVPVAAPGEGSDPQRVRRHWEDHRRAVLKNGLLAPGFNPYTHQL